MVHSIRLSWFVALVIGVFASLAFSQDCPELAGRWPYGPTQAVAEFGDYIAYGSGVALIIADGSNPSSPQQVGELEMPYRLFDVTVRGNLAYVANMEGGLRIVDIADPRAPQEVGSFVPAPVAGQPAPQTNDLFLNV